MAAEVLRQPSTVPMSSIPNLYPTFPSFAPKSKESPAPYPMFPSFKSKENKKVYYCQRCLNHDMPRPRKNHKCECPYADCNCDKCGLVEKRRILNLKLQIYNSEDLDKKPDDDEHDMKSKGGESVSDLIIVGD